jgi:hypothetical protein
MPTNRGGKVKTTLPPFAVRKHVQSGTKYQSRSRDVEVNVRYSGSTRQDHKKEKKKKKNDMRCGAWDGMGWDGMRWGITG